MELKGQKKENIAIIEDNSFLSIDNVKEEWGQLFNNKWYQANRR
jgi:hypothetical protein